MSAKLVIKKAGIELTGGAELEMGNWTIEIDEDEIHIRNNDMTYRLWNKSNGWMDFNNGCYRGTLFGTGVTVHSINKGTHKEFSFTREV